MAAFESTAADRRWRNFGVVRERDVRLVRWLWGMLLCLTLSLVPAGAYLFYQNECLKVSYEINAAHTEIERLLEVERRLKVERAELESPPKIEAWARRQPGLIQPEPGQILIVRPAATGPADMVARSAASREAPVGSGSSRR